MIAENRKEKDEKLAEMELVDQVMTFLLAGHETTSTAVKFHFRQLLIIAGLDFVYVGSTPGYSETTSRRS